MKKVISIKTTLLLLCFPAYSQDANLTDSQIEQKSKQLEIYFELNSCVITPKHLNNRERLLNLSNLLTKTHSDNHVIISNIEVKSYTITQW